MWLPVLIVVSWLFLDLSADPDLYARLAVGRLVLESGYVPTADPFAFVDKKELWIDHEWLAGVVFYAVYDAFGEGGLVILRGLFFIASACLLYLAAKPKRLSSLAIWSMALLGTAFVWRSTIRAQVFTYLFLPYLLWAFECYRNKNNKWPLYILPPIFVVWANAHGGFVVGLGLLAIFGAYQFLISRDRIPALITVFAIAATFINPYPGLSYWHYILEAVTMPRPLIDEWQGLRIMSHQAILPNIFLGGLVILLVRKRWLEFLLSAAGAFFAYRSSRLTPIFCMLAAVYISPLLAELASKIKVRQGFIDAGHFAVRSLSCLLLIGLIVYVVFNSKLKLDESEYPVAVTDYLLKNYQSGRVLIDFDYGSYLLWRGYPRFLVSMDGRYEELYYEDQVQLNHKALYGTYSEMLSAVTEINPDLIISEDRGEHAYAPHWRRIYTADGYAIYQIL